MKFQKCCNLAIAIAGLFFLSCSHSNPPEKTVVKEVPNRIYSKHVKDTFTLFVSLPADYSREKKYPLVYLTDANFHFETISATVKKYAEVGILPPLIMVGIGYRNFPIMDSLRDRDFSYPLAIPEYEMIPSGGGDKFLSFIEEELTPKVYSDYNIDTSKRILMGHSLGGYFAMYALHEALSGKVKPYHAYIAASPSLNYNKQYLIKEFEKTNTPLKTTKLFVTFGGLEDTEEEWEINDLHSQQVLDWCSKNLSSRVNYHGEFYTNLGHMDVPFPAFTRALEMILNPQDSVISTDEAETANSQR